MTKDDVMALTGRELENCVEINFFRERFYKNGGHDSPRYCTDANAVRNMETEIGRRGLRGCYVKQIWGLLGGNPNDPDAFFRWVEVWDFMTAPLETRCRAGLLAVLGEKGE